MKRGVILVTTVAILAMLVILVAGYTTPETAQAKGTLQIMVTDAPPEEEVTSIMVTVESVEVHKAAAGQNKQQQSTTNSTTTNSTTSNSTDKEAGWLPLDILAGNETFDLLQIQGIEEVLAVTELEAGNYTQIRMTISNVQVRLGDGDLQDVILPSGNLKFIHPFDIVGGQTTALLFDFDAEKSVNVTGSGKIIVKPVVKLSVTKPQKVEPGTKHVKIATPSLPNGAVGVSYNASLMANGGTTPYTWSIDRGALPAGLSLDSGTGVISGIPTTSGDSTFTVKVSDNSTPVKRHTKHYTITITGSGTLIITTMNVADGVEETAYNATVVALGGTPPYTWSVASGKLPAGLTIDTASGVISGTPTKKGNFNFTVQVSDNSTPASTDTQRLSIRIAKG
jgi:hypothetical protein